MLWWHGARNCVPNSFLEPLHMIFVFLVSVLLFKPSIQGETEIPEFLLFDSFSYLFLPLSPVNTVGS